MFSEFFRRRPGTGLWRCLAVIFLVLLGPAMAADTPASPQLFVPTEKLGADTIVDFPVDI